MCKSKICGLTILLLVSVSNIWGQDSLDWRLYRPADHIARPDTLKTALHLPGHVELVQSAAIAELDSIMKLNPSPLAGYRVQIFFGDRDQAQHERARFLKLYPEMNAYISYLAPNFRLRVGDFRSKIRSEAFKEEILTHFPGSYIVKDNIELPPLQLPSKAEELPPTAQ